MVRADGWLRVRGRLGVAYARLTGRSSLHSESRESSRIGWYRHVGSGRPRATPAALPHVALLLCRCSQPGSVAAREPGHAGRRCRRPLRHLQERRVDDQTKPWFARLFDERPESCVLRSNRNYDE